MVAFMPSSFKHAEEDEAGGEGGVEDPEEDESGDHEGKGYFFVDCLEGAECGCGVVLCPCIDVHDGAD